jgi:hypothetical protein
MNKYHNIPCTVDGERFDSIHEADRWRELQLLQRAGEIKDLRRQVPFEIIPACGKQRATHYIADFVYTEGGRQVVEDAKGVKTKDYLLKRKLMYHVHGIQIREV